MAAFMESETTKGEYEYSSGDKLEGGDARRVRSMLLLTRIWKRVHSTPAFFDVSVLLPTSICHQSSAICIYQGLEAPTGPTDEMSFWGHFKADIGVCLCLFDIFPVAMSVAHLHIFFCDVIFFAIWFAVCNAFDSLAVLKPNPLRASSNPTLTGPSIRRKLTQQFTVTGPAFRRPQAQQPDGHRPSNPTATGPAIRRRQAQIHADSRCLDL